jgi:hypothetical protein
MNKADFDVSMRQKSFEQVCFRLLDHLQQLITN